MLILSLKAKGNSVLMMHKDKNQDPQLKALTIGWRHLQGWEGHDSYLSYIFFPSFSSSIFLSIKEKHS